MSRKPYILKHYTAELKAGLGCETAESTEHNERECQSIRKDIQNVRCKAGVILSRNKKTLTICMQVSVNPEVYENIRGVFIMRKNEFMQRAIELAKKGAGHVNPNPLVGAVIVKEGRIIGEGYHEVYGSLHAERNALKNCTESAAGAEMYVTLEPCCHHGKQPPCTQAIIDDGIKKVYVGSDDPNSLVAGKGIRQLKAAGIEVTEHFMQEECDALNPVFFKYIRSGLPYIALKYAMSADGRIACDSGLSQWITGEEARVHVHKLRNYYSGILVGIGTVLADDPMLNCRMEGGRNPVRIVLDTSLRIPLNSRLVQTAEEIPLTVICGETSEYAGDISKADNSETVTKTDSVRSLEFSNKKERLEAAGVRVVAVPTENGHVSIKAALTELGKLGIDGILVEGGARINAAFAEAGCVDRVYAYIGAKLLGGEKLRSPLIGAGAGSPDKAILLGNPKVQVFGDDVLIRYDVRQGGGQ